MPNLTDIETLIAGGLVVLALTTGLIMLSVYRAIQAELREFT